MAKSTQTRRKPAPRRAHVAPQRRPRWQRDEVRLLRRLYRTRSNADIARLLGRSVSSIVFKGFRLGLAKGPQRLQEMGRENIRLRWDAPARARSTAKRSGKKRR